MSARSRILLWDCGIRDIEFRHLPADRRIAAPWRQSRLRRQSALIKKFIGAPEKYDNRFEDVSTARQQRDSGHVEASGAGRRAIEIGGSKAVHRSSKTVSGKGGAILRARLGGIVASPF